MGIQTQIDRIKGEVETQTAQIGTNAALIEQIKAALDGKAAGSGSGGASVETCTVVLNITNASVRAYAFSVFFDGIVQSYCVSDYAIGGQQVVTIENVICGSSATIIATGRNASLAFSVYDDTTFDDYIHVGGKTAKDGGLFTIGKGIDGIVTIDVFDDD